MNTARPVTILTGASRGMGRAMAELLLQRGHRLLTLQRHPTDQPVPAGADLQAWAVDLADPLPVAQDLQAWIAALVPAQVSALTLINNAALLVEPGPLAGADLAAVSRATRASLEAPLLLTSAFLRASAVFDVPRKVLNISSGLGRHAMAGSAVYCADKAGMDHFSRAVALEESAHANGAAIVCLAPGIIDTDMQAQLRSADAAAFPERQRFAEYKAGGRLDSPQAAAEKVLAYLDRPDFGRKVVADVRDPD